MPTPSGLLAALFVTALLGALPPTHVAKVAETPDFLQTNAKAGFSGIGVRFCAPVAVSNSFMWLAGHGYENLKPEGSGNDEDAQITMIRILASAEMMNTNLETGTGVTGLLEGARRYVRKAGYRCRKIEFRGWRAAPSQYRPHAQPPDPAWMKELIADDNSAVWLNVGWYNYDEDAEEYRRVGGHWVTLAGYGEDEDAREAPDVFIVKDPSPRAGSAPANEHIQLEKIEKGTLTGDNKGLPKKATGYYQITDGMHIPKKAKSAILDALAVVVLGR